MNQPHSSLDRTRWVSDAGDILWAKWDEDFIAFHRPSGKTHLLNAASETLLTHILVEPKSTTEVVRELSGDEDGVLDEGLIAEIDQLLMHLEEIGLVERS